MEPDFDDTDMTPEEFERRMAEGIPCEVYVPSGNVGGTTYYRRFDWRAGDEDEGSKSDG